MFRVPKAPVHTHRAEIFAFSAFLLHLFCLPDDNGHDGWSYSRRLKPRGSYCDVPMASTGLVTCWLGDIPPTPHWCFSAMEKGFEKVLAGLHNPSSS